MAACAFLFACSDSGGPTNPPGPDPLPEVNWTWVNGGLGVDSLYAIAGASPNRILVASTRGVLLFDGVWHMHKPAPPGERLRAIWMASASRAFAVGDGGAIYTMSGDDWDPIPGPVSSDLHDVSGLTASLVYACGEGATPGTGVVLVLDGASWTKLVDAPVELFGIWAAARDDFYVAGRDGYFAHYDGHALTPVMPGFPIDLFDVWGSSAGNVYAVGDDGIVIHYDGVQTVSIPTGGLARWRSISGIGPGDIDVAGSDGSLLHFDGAAWTPASGGLHDDFVGVWGAASGEAFAIGESGSLIERRPAPWRVRFAGSSARLHAVAYDIIVGQRGNEGIAIVGTEQWSFPEPLRGLTAFTPDDAYAVGDRGTIVHFSASDWTPDVSNTTENLASVTGLRNRFGDPLRMYAVGSGGTVLVWKGSSWTPAALPAGAASMNFVDIWAAAIDDVFAVADNSNLVLRYDDPVELADWTLEAMPTAGSVVAIGGWQLDTYAATSLGEILHHDGKSWKRIASAAAPINDLRVVGEKSFYAVGQAGFLAYYEAGHWSQFQPNYFGEFFGVWARSGWSTVAVGTNGAVWVHRSE